MSMWKKYPTGIHKRSGLIYGGKIKSVYKGGVTEALDLIGPWSTRLLCKSPNKNIIG